MDKIKSGKELCNQFFEALIDKDDIDQEMAVLLKEFYFEGRLTKDNILQELKILREKKNE
jgi:hypothetical protein